MKDAEPTSTKASTSEADVVPEADARLSPTDQLAANLAVLEKAVSLKETRMISGRLLRQTAGIRHQLTPQILSDFVTKALPEDATMGPILLKQLRQVACLQLPLPSVHQSKLIAHFWHRLRRVPWTLKILPRKLPARQQLPQAACLRLRLMLPCSSRSTLSTTSCAQRYYLSSPYIHTHVVRNSGSFHCCSSYRLRR